MKKKNETKSQHFVSRFYLKGFSADEVRFQSIHVKDLSQHREIGLGTQCQEDYFYGDDGIVESALGEVEAVAAPVLKAVAAKGEPPKAHSTEDAILRSHVYFQWGRTREYAVNSEALFDKSIKTAFRDTWRQKGMSDEEIDSLRIGTERPGQYATAVMAELLPLMNDLSLKLILAGSTGEFVTSDCPVVIINPFYHGKFEGATTGINVQGIVMIFPLTPTALAFYYDRDYYRVGSPRHSAVTLSDPADLDTLNTLQFLHAHHMVYFRDSLHAPRHLEAFRKVARLREAERKVVREAFSAEPGDNSSILHMFRAHIPYRTKLSFLSVLTKQRGGESRVTQLPERNPMLAAAFSEYERQLKAKLCRPGFIRFLESFDLKELPEMPQSSGRSRLYVTQ